MPESSSKPFEKWEAEQWNCSHCGWTGPGDQLEIYEVFEGLNEMACPNCKEKIGVVSWPTPVDEKVDFDRLSSPEQLLELPEDSIVLIWDIERYDGGDTIIRFGNQVVWREPAFYEGYERFIEVANILVQKYGSRLRDLIPSKSSEMFLYGDHLISLNLIEKCRERIRAGQSDDK